ncbi:YaaR family protein [Acidaminobacter sp. JC074]|uniref:YaaR family protein n=1 Tax=Acidaminobacter sp. JC074 TaxID=2530199 RepID=UPI001F1178DF|nr:YaaR family protein [Acidaminobacter sp. JC074]
MKVNSVRRTERTSKKKINRVEPSLAFDEIFALTEEEGERSHLDEMLDDIKKKGRELSEKRDVEILIEYKEMVKQFVEEAVNFGLKVVERRGHGRAGRSKIMRMVSMIDEKMINLTEDLLQQEKSSLKLLTKIGEIEGLLLNIYA